VERRTVAVSVPATSANLGPGFDCLGLALDLRNEVTLEAEGWTGHPVDPELAIEIEGEGTRGVAPNGRNLVYRAARKVFEQCGRYPLRLRLHLRCVIPVGKGLGSSASAIVGGVWGASALLGEESDDGRWLALAAALEGHPDNIVPAVCGGFTLAWTDQAAGSPRWVSVPVKEDVRAVVAVPSFSLRTAEARRQLPRQVPLADAVFNLSHVAAVVAGALRGDWAGAAAAMEDRLHEPYRARLVPGFGEVCRAARAAGAAAAVLSGAGPSILALLVEENGDRAGERCAGVAEAMEAAFRRAGVEALAMVLRPAREGVRVTVSGVG
jgi:homoserine kinase